MYAAVRHYQADPGATDEISRLVESGFVPIVSGVEGFQGYYLVDGGNGRLVSISIFQDGAGAEESTRRAADWVQQNLAQYIQSPAQVTSGEVTVEKTA